MVLWSVHHWGLGVAWLLALVTDASPLPLCLPVLLPQRELSVR